MTNDDPRNPRRQFLLGDLDLASARGFEVGALASPLVTQAQSSIRYVDHDTADALRAKYAGDPAVDAERIVAVDVVWGERTLPECFAGEAPFDYAIASHVIEHVPDFVGWLHEIASVLRPGGTLMLAVPDKRFTFDLLRQPSRLAEMIEAYVLRHRRPAPAQVFDFNANAVEVDLLSAWAGTIEPDRLRHFVTPEGALDRSIAAARGGDYIDSHCWVFTAASFLALCARLADLRLMPFALARFQAPIRGTNEMLVVLTRVGEGAEARAGAAAGFRATLDSLPPEEFRPTHLEPDMLWEQLVRNAALAAARGAELDRLKASRSWRWTGILRGAIGAVRAR